jgi:hypothetical protein
LVVRHWFPSTQLALALVLYDPRGRGPMGEVIAFHPAR